MLNGELFSKVVRAVPGAPLVVFELPPASPLGSLRFSSAYNISERNVKGLGDHFTPGFPLSGIPEHACHKVRTVIPTSRESTCYLKSSRSLLR